MMKSLAILSIFTTAVLAQSSSSSAAAASSSSNPLIPTGISTGCSTYLTTLNSDATLTPCTAPLISATAPYAPGGNATTPTAASITTALDTLCSTTYATACPDSIIRGKLAAFYSACSAELTSSHNNDVIRSYDVLYALTPLRQAICSKDDNGKYCANETPAAGANGTSNAIVVTGTQAGLAPADIQKYISQTVSVNKRDTSAAALIPNTTTFHNTNLVFLFLQPSLPSAQLCTSCTRSVLTSYINFESNAPYAPGINQSPLMSGQSALYTSILSTCGKSFLSGAVQAAGGLSGGILSGGASRSIGGDVSGMVAAMVGAVAVGFAAVL